MKCLRIQQLDLRCRACVEDEMLQADRARPCSVRLRLHDSWLLVLMQMDEFVGTAAQRVEDHVWLWSDSNAGSH